jgi:hypothetical protein
MSSRVRFGVGFAADLLHQLDNLGAERLVGCPMSPRGQFEMNYARNLLLRVANLSAETLEEAAR